MRWRADDLARIAALGGYLAAVAVIGLGLGTLVRRTAGTLAIMVLLLLVIPEILALLARRLDAAWVERIADYSPGPAGFRFIAGDWEWGLVLLRLGGGRSRDRCLGPAPPGRLRRYSTGGTRPASYARTAACTRLRTSRRLSTALTYALTVPSTRNSRRPISALDRPGPDQGQHLPLPRGQGGDPVGGGRSAAGLARGLLDDPVGDLRREEGGAAGRRPDGRHQLVRVAGLEQEARRAAVQRAGHVLALARTWSA